MKTQKTKTEIEHFALLHLHFPEFLFNYPCVKQQKCKLLPNYNFLNIPGGPTHSLTLLFFIYDFFSV